MGNARRMILVVLAAVTPASMAAHAPSPERAAAAAERPAAVAPIRTDHAVGYYDPTLQRVVVIGGAGDPKDGDRDRVWSWNGTRWDLEADAGPPGRVNAVAPMTRGQGAPWSSAARARRRTAVEEGLAGC